MRLADRFNIGELLRQRGDQRSFHVSSQDHVRIEFHNFLPGEGHVFSFDGNVVLTCYRGEFSIGLGGEKQKLAELDQVVVMPSNEVRLECHEAGTIQFIWAPPFGRVQGSA